MNIRKLMRKKSIKNLIKLSAVLYLLFSPSKTEAQEVSKYLYIFGETGADYLSNEKNLHFRIGQLDLFGKVWAGKGVGFIELVFDQPGEAE